MDRSNLSALERMAPKKCRAQIRLMVKGTDVPDPYYEGDFSGVFDMLERASRSLLDSIRK